MSYIETKLRDIGNSKGIIIPAEFLAELDFDKDSPLFITKTHDGLMITGFDPEKQKQLEIAGEFLRDYGGVLRALANK